MVAVANTAFIAQIVVFRDVMFFFLRELNNFARVILKTAVSVTKQN